MAGADGGGGDNDEDKEQVLPCTLDDETQRFVRLIFDEDMFKDAMVKLKLDPAKLPLGALSVKQLERGVAALQEVERAVKRGKSAADVAGLSGVFYSIIPHAFGMARPPPLNTSELIREKFEMLQVLRDIDEANQMTTASKSPRKSSSKSSQKNKSKTAAEAVPHPIDAKFQQLQTTLTLLDPSSDADYGVIRTYLQRTAAMPVGGSAAADGFLSAPGHDQLRAAWRVDRHGDGGAFDQDHGSDGNRWLLWHGTNTAVVAAILKSGLRIMPHSGGRVGRGIYLADAQAKRCGHTCSAPRSCPACACL